MSIIKKVFGASPFGPLLDHAKKVHKCVQLIAPIMDAVIEEDYTEVRRLQDEVSKLEYQADLIKHEIRENLPRKYFLPVSREDIETYLYQQDEIADAVQDFAVVLIIRPVKIHPKLKQEFVEFVNHVISVAAKLLKAAEEMQNLAETSFRGAEARQVLGLIKGLGEEEWKADRMMRQLSMNIYKIEKELDVLTILFYEKMIKALSQLANAAENTGDVLRSMIIKDR